MMTAQQFAEFMKVVKDSKDLPDPPKDGLSEEAKNARKKQAAIKAKAHKTKRHAHYIVGREGAFVGGKLYAPGEVVMLPHDKMPSKTWRPATEKGVALAEEAAAAAAALAEELAGTAAEDDALDDDEIDVGQADEDAGDDEDAEAAPDEPEADEAAPTPPPAAPKKPKAKAPAAKPKAGKASKPGRASDQDVA